MSLVAYDASSDEESDYEDNESTTVIAANPTVAKVSQMPSTNKLTVSNGSISDEDDDYISQVEDKDTNCINRLSKLLPKPKNDENFTELLENFAKPTFAALPIPKAVGTQDIKEVDDEFLHKKPSKEIPEKPNKNNDDKKMHVKITIPSLKNFQDVEKEIADKARNKSAFIHSRASVSSGLLSILPKAKSEQNFAKATNTSSNKYENLNLLNTVKPAMSSFVPDSVKHRRPATNTEDVERLKPNKKNLHNQNNKHLVQSTIKADSDESGDDNTDSVDFFSFNTDENLPEVSATEINALVDKKVEKIVETSANFLRANESQKFHDVAEMQLDEHELVSTRKRHHQEHQLDSEALQALVGGSTKRRRQKQSDIQVIDINSSQVMPNKDEWMRTALASSTTYQPTGVLVDEEPASGTRRKHQITYLAHKAKANEAELQAMWSANRQNRRATQNKYGF